MCPSEMDQTLGEYFYFLSANCSLQIQDRLHIFLRHAVQLSAAFCAISEAKHRHQLVRLDGDRRHYSLLFDILPNVTGC
jgi:hypothetical protein